MYIFAMVAQVGFAGVYVLGDEKAAEPRVIMIGFDGLDPRVLKAAAGEIPLPVLQDLMDRNTKIRLRSTIPPETPVAWKTFATGVGPGKHGVFDFVDRNPETYYPILGTLDRVPPVVFRNFLLLPPRAKAKSRKKTKKNRKRRGTKET